MMQYTDMAPQLVSYLFVNYLTLNIPRGSTEDPRR